MPSTRQQKTRVISGRPSSDTEDEQSAVEYSPSEWNDAASDGCRRHSSPLLAVTMALSSKPSSLLLSPPPSPSASSVEISASAEAGELWWRDRNHCRHRFLRGGVGRRPIVRSGFCCLGESTSPVGGRSGGGEKGGSSPSASSCSAALSRRRSGD